MLKFSEILLLVNLRANSTKFNANVSRQMRLILRLGTYTNTQNNLCPKNRTPNIQKGILYQIETMISSGNNNNFLLSLGDWSFENFKGRVISHACNNSILYFSQHQYPPCSVVDSRLFLLRKLFNKFCDDMTVVNYGNFFQSSISKG